MIDAIKDDPVPMILCVILGMIIGYLLEEPLNWLEEKRIERKYRRRNR